MVSSARIELVSSSTRVKSVKSTKHQLGKASEKKYGIIWEFFPNVSESLTLVDLTDVSLVDEDANSILADDTNRAITGNLKMQVAPPNFRILTKFQDLHQISGSQPNFRISTKFQDVDQISGF